VKFSYHTHAPDFKPIDGQRPFDLMVASTDPAIRYELDVAWVAAGGADPVAVIDKHWQPRYQFPSERCRQGRQSCDLRRRHPRLRSYS
jgi:hypothetical protein